MQYCTSCGAEVEPSNQYCAQCGSALGEDMGNCAECDAAIDADLAECPECGYNPSSNARDWGVIGILFGAGLTLTGVGAIIGIPVIFFGIGYWIGHFGATAAE